MESRAIVQVFTNLEDAEIVKKEAIELSDKIRRTYEGIGDKAKLANKMVTSLLNRTIVLGEKQNIYVETVSFDMVSPLQMPASQMGLA